MADESPRFPPQSRYAQVAGYSRRSVLGMGLGALAALAGCRSSDDDVFANGNAPTEASGELADLPTSAPSPSSAGSSEATLQVQLDGQAAASTGDAGVGQGSVDTSDGSTSTSQVEASAGDPTTTMAAGDTTSSTAAETSSPTTSTSTSASTTTSTTATTATTAPTTTVSSTTSTTQPVGPARAVPAGSDLVVTFTYEQAAGGKNVPPYIAVWIEDDSGDLVETVALWYQQFGRGENWLPDLRRWYNATGGSVTDSGPTRAPGQHQVAWGGASEFGEPMPPGRYYVCVESARERGPYSLVRTAADLNGSAVNIQLGSDGELKAAAARTA